MERLNQLIKKQYAKVPKECKIAALLVCIFNLKNKLSIILISGILIVFSSWTATSFFIFTAPYCFLAAFLAY